MVEIRHRDTKIEYYHLTQRQVDKVQEFFRRLPNYSNELPEQYGDNFRRENFNLINNDSGFLRVFADFGKNRIEVWSTLEGLGIKNKVTDKIERLLAKSGSGFGKTFTRTERYPSNKTYQSKTA